MRTWAGGALLVGTVLLAACAGSEPAPRRIAIAVPDEVGQVDPTLLVGTWQCRELNPYPGQPPQSTEITYDAGGSFQGEARPSAESPIGRLLITATGNWRVEGDRLVTSNVESKAQALDGNPAAGFLAGIGSAFANGFLAAERDGATDILSLTKHELVMRPIGLDDPPILSCTR
jgi:hypothetical protein